MIPDVCLCLRPRASEQFFKRDRQIAHALAGRVIDGIGNRGRYRDRCQLAKALRAEWARLVIEVTDEQDVELRDVGIRRHKISRVIAVQETARHRIGLRLLEEGLSDAPR